MNKLIKKSLAIVSVIVATSVAAMAQANGQSSSAQEDNSKYILTPKAPETPRINGPKIYGASPKADFIFKVPATGVRPMTFTAKGLPKGLKMDSETGIITGSVKKAGEYEVTIKAVNSLGEDSRILRIVIGDKICLTPPMGWNSWNCWGNSVSQEKVMSSAQALLDKGLDNYGWSYINIDDGWQGLRGGKYNAIQSNKKFPDMKGLTDFLHSNGLKAGIYSGPWVSTYAAHIGTGCENPEGTYWWVEAGKVNENYRMEKDPEGKITRTDLWYHGKYTFAKQDAQQWADWGFDYLKYDWNPNDEFHLRNMRNAIDATGRDIVYSISNSSKIAIAPILMEVAECWRTTGDIRDTWDNMSKIGFNGQDRWAPYKGPGHWPDADMLVVGNVGWGPKIHASKLTPDEQYTHMTLWSILSSPLLIGCDLATIDDFTLSLLCNNEVIDVNQDPLGYQASKVYWDSTYATYIKPLEDGSLAVAMFNLSDSPKKIGFVPSGFGLYSDQTIRDLWRQQDVAKISCKDRWEVEVAPHGCVYVKLYPGVTPEQPLGNNR